MPRFVILRHEPAADQARALHWDLMLEWSGALRTWALPGEPQADLEMWVEPLPDHRLAYLDYEGPVSGNRGSVTRWDAGEYRLERSSDDELAVFLKGAQFAGLATIRRDGGDPHSWRVSFSTAPTTG